MVTSVRGIRESSEHQAGNPISKILRNKLMKIRTYANSIDWMGDEPIDDLVPAFLISIAEQILKKLSYATEPDVSPSFEGGRLDIAWHGMPELILTLDENDFWLDAETSETVIIEWEDQNDIERCAQQAAHQVQPFFDVQ